MRVVVDLARCERHGLCTYAAPEVFELDDDGELHYDPNPPEHLREQVQDAVAGCPVEAITLLPSAPGEPARPPRSLVNTPLPTPADSGSPQPPTPSTRIKVIENGPLQVKGDVELLDHDGNRYDLKSRRSVLLCRCGGSTTKPFCDGTHSRTGFAAAERAVAAEQDIAQVGQ